MSKVEFVGVNQDGSLNQSGTLNLSKISNLILSNEKVIKDIDDNYNLLITDNNNDFIPDYQNQIENLNEKIQTMVDAGEIEILKEEIKGLEGQI